MTDIWFRGEPLPPGAVALLIQDAEVQALGEFRRGQAITSFQRRIAISNISFAPTPLPVDLLLRALPQRVRRHAASALKNGGPIPTATWAGIRSVLLGHPDFRHQLRRIERSLSPPRWISDLTTRGRSVLEFEQEALGTALSLAGLEREPIRSWTAPDDPLPFLAGLDHVTLREDHLLVHDMQAFGRWDRTDATGFYSVFEDRTGRKVSVLNINRDRLETTLGADLVYFSARHNAFTLVQYKRMTWHESSRSAVSRDAIYRARSDRNIERQVERMRRVEKVRSSNDGDIAGYRLTPGFCFLKFCRPDVELGTIELSKGFYVDLRLWDLMAATADGGHPTVRYNDNPRHLNNTQFITFVRDGWIGSTGDATARVSRYISESLRSRHSVTLAAAVAGTGADSA